MNWRETLAQTLRSLPGDTLCAIDAGAQQVARALLPDVQVRLRDAAQAGAPAQIALVHHALHGLDVAQTNALLARVRDFVAPRIIVIADAQCALTRADFLALGFEILATDADAQISLYQFDLATYKQVPDWLNARFWAHPERWKP